MAVPIQQTVTDSDRRHFDFIDTLCKISDRLSARQTAILKLYCAHIIPRGMLEKMKHPIDVFDHLQKLNKLDSENLDFLEELLRRIRRLDLVTEVLRPFQPADRELPESQELLPETSREEVTVELAVNGDTRMVEETKERYRNNLARIGRTKKSNVKYNGYKKHGSILVQFVVPRETTDLLRLMTRQSDPRLVFMGVTSVRIGREAPVDVPEEVFHDIQSEFAVRDWLPQDDIQVGCRVSPPRKAIPQCWSSLSALNLFSDALPLHLQVAESLEYQGFSYCLVQALMQRDRLRQDRMEQLIQRLKNTEVDYDTFIENRLKDALETIAVLEDDLQKAREDTEIAAKQVISEREKRDKEYQHTEMTLRSKLVRSETRAKSLKDENNSLKRLLKQAQEEKMKVEETE